MGRGEVKCAALKMEPHMETGTTTGQGVWGDWMEMEMGKQ